MSEQMIEKTIVLACSIERAFELVTQEISDWWPAERRHTNDAASQMFLLETGRFFERASDGREVDLGKVRIWAPPHRLVLDFYPGTDPAHPTEVEILLTSDGEGAKRTLLTLHHRPTPASAALFEKRAPRYVGSWDLVLPSLERWAAAR